MIDRCFGSSNIFSYIEICICVGDYTKVCQMLSGWTKNWPRCKKMLFWICYLFLRWPALLAVQAFSRINNIFKWANYVGYGAGKMRLGSYDITWYTEHNGSTFVTVSQTLMWWAQFSIHLNNIWQSITTCIINILSSLNMNQSKDCIFKLWNYHIINRYSSNIYS